MEKGKLCLSLDESDALSREEVINGLRLGGVEHPRASEGSSHCSKKREVVVERMKGRKEGCNKKKKKEKKK